MSEAANLQRRRLLLMMSGGAAAALAAGGLASLPRSAPTARRETGQAILPGIRETLGAAGLIMVTTSEESYHIVRDPDGWVIPEKGRYPVREERILALGQALSSMAYDRAMTRDPRKFDRLGLGDPAEGGAGALLEAGDGHGETFVKLIVGRRDGRTYIRDPDDLQAWSVSGEDMPPLHRAARWLDLDIVSVTPDQISEVRVQSAASRPYRLVRTGDGAYALSPAMQGRAPAAAFLLKLVAEPLTRLAPTDVAPVSQLADAERAGTHTTVLANGAELRVTALRWRNQGWVTVEAAAPPGSGAPFATMISARANGWAFGLTESDWGAYTTPLDALMAE
jgi:hypothetical protein